MLSRLSSIVRDNVTEGGGRAVAPAIPCENCGAPVPAAPIRPLPIAQPIALIEEVPGTPTIRNAPAQQGSAGGGGYGTASIPAYATAVNLPAEAPEPAASNVTVIPPLGWLLMFLLVFAQD